MTDRAIRWLFLALLAGVAGFCVLRLEVTQSIAHFLPSGREAELADLSRALIESELSRNMVLSVSGGPERREAAEELARALADHPEVAWAQTGVGPEEIAALHELYFERRVYFAADRMEDVAALTADSGLTEGARRLRERLRGPASALVSRSAGADPLGLFERHLARARAARPPSELGDPTGDGHALVFVGLRSSPFDSARQAPLLEAADAAFASVAAARPGLRLEGAGVNRIAVASERIIRDDVDFISLVSVTGVALLFFAVFRSPRSLLLALLPPVSGILAAAALGGIAFAPVHLLTLGFGLALIGVAIDYPIHVLNHHALAAGPRSGWETLRRVRPSLLAGGLTTGLAFGMLMLSRFPGVGAMGAFAASGIAVAVAVSLFALPAFLPVGGRASGFQRAGAAALGRAADGLARRRWISAGLVALYVAVVLVGLPRVQWVDDPGRLTTPDAELLAEDERVRRRVGDVDMGRFVIVQAPDRESALALNDAAALRLRDAVAAGHLAGVRSVHAFLWSEALQTANLEALRASPDLSGRIDRRFAEAGFRPGAFAAFDQAVARPALPPLRPEDLADSPLRRALAASVVEAGDQWAVVTYLRGIEDVAGIRASLADLDGAILFDQPAVLEAIYASYRRSTLQLVALGAGLVLVVLWIRYRRLRWALLAFLPCALVALTTLSVYGVLGTPVNLFAVISLVLVMGMGVDYGVFVVDGARDRPRLGATLLGLAVSCGTTLFVFGTLALSEQPVLRSIGVTTGLGILLAFAITLPLVAWIPAEERA